MTRSDPDIATPVTTQRIFTALAQACDQVPFFGSSTQYPLWAIPFETSSYNGSLTVMLMQPVDVNMVRVYSTAGLDPRCDPARTAEELVYALNPTLENAMISQQVMDDGRVLITCESSFLADTATDKQLEVWFDEAIGRVVEGMGRIMDAYVKWGSDV